MQSYKNLEMIPNQNFEAFYRMQLTQGQILVLGFGVISSFTSWTVEHIFEFQMITLVI